MGGSRVSSKVQGHSFLNVCDWRSVVGAFGRAAEGGLEGGASWTSISFNTSLNFQQIQGVRELATRSSLL